MPHGRVGVICLYALWALCNPKPKPPIWQLIGFLDLAGDQRHFAWVISRVIMIVIVGVYTANCMRLSAYAQSAQFVGCFGVCVLAKMSVVLVVVLVLVFETHCDYIYNDKSPSIAKGNPNEPAS